MLNFVLSNSTWKNDELFVTFRQPFDLIAQTAMLEPSSGTGGGENPSTHPKWLPGPDENANYVLPIPLQTTPS
jgi:site-specific DNA recombinase